MTITRRPSLALSPLLLALSGATASFADAPPGDLLRGPTVVDEGEASRAMPERGFDGAMATPDARPELVVLRSLSLTDRERTAIDALLSERNIEIRRLVADHSDLLLELVSLRQADDRAGFRRRLAELRSLTQPLLSPTLAERITAALEPASATLFAERLAALRETLRDERADEGMAGERRPRAQTGRGLAHRGDVTRDAGREIQELLGVLQEMGQTLRNELDFGRAQLDEFLDRVAATPEQADRIRTLFRESAVGADAARNHSDRARIFGEVMRLLTPEQRRAALRAVREM